MTPVRRKIEIQDGPKTREKLERPIERRKPSKIFHSVTSLEKST